MKKDRKITEVLCMSKKSSNFAGVFYKNGKRKTGNGKDKLMLWQV